MVLFAISLFRQRGAWVESVATLCFLYFHLGPVLGNFPIAQTWFKQILVSTHSSRDMYSQGISENQQLRPIWSSTSESSGCGQIYVLPRGLSRLMDNTQVELWRSKQTPSPSSHTSLSLDNSLHIVQ